MTRKRPDLKIRTYEKFDGAIWRRYETPDYRILLTQAGRHLLATKRMHRLLGPYIEDLINGNDGEDSNRVFLAEGGNARVFSLGEDFIIKESLPDSESSLFASIERTDMLKDSIQKHCPRWIDVPNNYGALTSKRNMYKQYMLSQKIDHGVTVGDILDYVPGHPNRTINGALAPGLLEKFGPISPQVKEEVSDRFETLKIKVGAALQQEGLEVDNFLTDINSNPYNVVLERLATPEAGSFIKFWVIDQ